MVTTLRFGDGVSGPRGDSATCATFNAEPGRWLRPDTKEVRHRSCSAGRPRGSIGRCNAFFEGGRRWGSERILLLVFSVAMPLADAAISRSSERAADRYAAHVRFGVELAIALAALGTVNHRRGLIRLVGRHPQTARRLHDSMSRFGLTRSIRTQSGCWRRPPAAGHAETSLAAVRSSREHVQTSGISRPLHPRGQGLGAAQRGRGPMALRKRRSRNPAQIQLAATALAGLRARE